MDIREKVCLQYQALLTGDVTLAVATTSSTYRATSASRSGAADSSRMAGRSAIAMSSSSPPIAVS